MNPIVTDSANFLGQAIQYTAITRDSNNYTMYIFPITTLLEQIIMTINHLHCLLAVK
jgi:hypothetical protein